MQIRKTQQKDIEQIAEIFQDARVSLAKLSVPQWQGPYPARCEAIQDMMNDIGYVAEKDGRVVGYAAFQTKVDKNYLYIEGKWLNDAPYMSIHRSCVLSTYKRQGIMRAFFNLAVSLAKEKGIDNLRIDTHKDNIAMNQAIVSFGFTYCGVIYVEDKTARNAYQLVIRDNKASF